MKVLLHCNYLKVAVSHSSSEAYVSVLLAQNKAEHFPYSGFISFDIAVNRLKQDPKRGYFAAFFGSVGWKDSDWESWNFTASQQYGVAYVEKGAYVVIDDNQPLIWTADAFSGSTLPVRHPQTVEDVPNNVVSLFGN